MKISYSKVGHIAGRRRTRARTFLVPVAMTFLSVGCASNRFESRSIAGLTAPAPTRVLSVVKCLSDHHTGAERLSVRLEQGLEARSNVSAPNPDERVALCLHLGNDKALSTWETDWERVTRRAGPTIKGIAATRSARSLIVPLVQSVTTCKDPTTDVFKGKTLPWDSRECWESDVRAALFVFSAEGELLWKSAEERRAISAADQATESKIQSMADSLFSAVPVRFVKSKAEEP